MKKRTSPFILLAIAGLILVGAVTFLQLKQTNEEGEERLNVRVDQGETVASLQGSDFLGDYSIEDDVFGTMMTVDVDEEAGTRTIIANSLPNHETGDFPNDGNPNAITEQNNEYVYPLVPGAIGQAQEIKEPGVAINGIKFDPGTGEFISCSGGQMFRIEAIQDYSDLGLDFNNAHVQPSGTYHYHGVSQLLVALNESEEDLVHVGFAADGNLMYYSKNGAYESSYALGELVRDATGCTRSTPDSSNNIDVTEIPLGTLTSDWVYEESRGDLDECNGIQLDGEYAYVLTNEYPYIPRCLKGEMSNSGNGGQPPPPRP